MKLEVYLGDKLLWTFPNVTEAFALGYAYAVVFNNHLREAGKEYRLVSDVTNDRGIRVYRAYVDTQDAKRIARYSGVIDNKIHRKADISNVYTIGLSQFDAYNYWIINNDYQDNLLLIHDNDLQVLKGLTTGMRDVGILGNSIILTWPYKDGQWYNIPDVNLKYPDEM